jgi:SulP family sulfate permease
VKIPKIENLAGEFWGGLAAMLVALPSAIAFGVTIFSPLGGSYAAQGALAGILGAFAVGLVAAACGGTNRLISSPCAPAAAVLAAVTIQMSNEDIGPDLVVAMLALIGLLCGVLQIAFGAVGLGRLIKYMPYPVVSGYLSGVGLVIILSQVPKFFGAPHGASMWDALTHPAAWLWPGIVVGAVTIVVMVAAPRLTKAVPAAILALAAGVLTYFGLALADPSLLELSGNPLVVGPFGGSEAGFFDAIVARWNGIRGLTPDDVANIAMPALTLAVLLSIDTLKTCVVLDALTRSRHNSNRELIGQGLGNLASTIIGGVQGAGTMGATLVNISSGAQTRVSGLIEGALALAAFLVLGKLIAWVPVAALAGILIVIGLRMIDWHSLHLLRARSTVLDFVVILSVVVVAETVSLIAASGVGIVLAVMLFIREQIGGSIVRRRAYGDRTFSKQVRLQEEMEILEKRGGETAIFELQGSLFFGTTDQLYTEMEQDIKARRFIILDLRRVQSVDFTAAHMLEQIEGMMADRKGLLIFSELPRNLPSGRDMQKYFDQVGLVRSEHHAKVFEELDDALEWVEDRIIGEERREQRATEKPLELREIDLFAGRKEDTLAALDACMEKRSYKAGEKICSRGEVGHEIYFIRRGTVRIMLPISDKQGHHLATFGRGDFFGEVSFLDRDPRSADAVAFTDADLFMLPRARFDVLSEQHKMLALQVIEGLARKLAVRLRYANAELRALEES